MTTTVKTIKSIRHDTTGEVYTSMDSVTLLVAQFDSPIGIKLILDETNIFELIGALEKAASQQGFNNFKHCLKKENV